VSRSSFAMMLSPPDAGTGAGTGGRCTHGHLRSGITVRVAIGWATFLVVIYPADPIPIPTPPRPHTIAVPASATIRTHTLIPLGTGRGAGDGGGAVGPVIALLRRRGHTVTCRG
jgi:hypothetical protein